MKKILLCLFIILGIVLLNGCAPLTPDDSLSTVEPNTSTSMSETQQNISAERTVYHEQQGVLTDSAEQGVVTVYTNTTVETAPDTDVYLGVQIGEDHLTYPLGKGLPLVFAEGGGLFLADLDGNGTDEIILFMEVSGNGGLWANVFSVKGNEIVLLNDLNDLPLNISATAIDDFKVCLENPAVSFSAEIDISKEYSQEYFDKNGRFNGDPALYYPEIYMGTVIFTEGLPIIQVYRYVKLTNCLGSLNISFQYDTNSSELKLVEMSWT